MQIRIGALARQVVVLATLLAAGAANAVSIDFFHSAQDNGTASATANISLSGSVTVNLWVDPTSAPGGGVIDIQDIVIRASGAISITSFSCDTSLCLKGNPIPGQDPTNHFRFTFGNAQDSNNVPFQIGTVVVNVTGTGALTFESGTFFASDFSSGNLDAPEVVVTFVPEPTLATLLAGALLAVGWRARRLA